MKTSCKSLVLCAALLIGGCASMVPPPDAQYSVLSSAYQLDSGDSLRVTVFEQDNLSNTYLVDQAGYITMPLVGEVPARGKTTNQLSAEVATRLRNGYVRNPDVAIEVAQYRPFFITGEITNGGQYNYVDGMTVQKAIAIAGGFNSRAVTRRVLITRQMNGEIVHGYADLNAPVRPGDVITIEERLF